MKATNRTNKMQLGNKKYINIKFSEIVNYILDIIVFIINLLDPLI